MSKVKKVLLFIWSVLVMLVCSLALLVISTLMGFTKGVEDFMQFFPSVKKAYIRYFKS